MVALVVTAAIAAVATAAIAGRFGVFFILIANMLAVWLVLRSFEVEGFRTRRNKWIKKSN